MLYVVLVEPETPGNVGAVARVMKNFGFANLVLISPKCDHLSSDAMGRATHAAEILKKARIAKGFKALKSFSQVIGTTGCLGRDYNLTRSPLTPEQLSSLSKRLKIPLKGRSDVAVVFGREGSGLSNSELRQCDVVVSIPASADYPVLNVSHAAAIVLYELFRSFSAAAASSHFVLASAKDKSVALGMVNDIIKSLKPGIPKKKQAYLAVWHRLLGKSFLTRREIFVLLGFLRKTLAKLEVGKRNGK